MKKNLLGVYLTGSYGTDYFNSPTSDLDVAVILHTSLTQNVRKHIGILHLDLHQKFPKWGKRIECSYIPQAMLESIHPPLSARPYVNDGKLYEEDALYGFEWLINLHCLQKNGIPLRGPDLQFLLPTPIDIKWVKEASLQNFQKEWRSLTLEDLSLKESNYQTYIVLTLCRILFLHLKDCVASKQEAAYWVKTIYPKWASLIGASENWEKNQKLNISSDEILRFTNFLKERIFAPNT